MGRVFSDYYKWYINSDEWRRRRVIALKRARNRCRICGSTKRLEVHHKTYEHLGNERDNELTVLCHRCHGWFTIILRLARFVKYLYSRPNRRRR